MKKLFKSAFVLSLAVVFAFGLSLASAPDADALLNCPPCYVPNGASGWSQYGSCIGGMVHCPLSYRTYKNNRSGQICRAQDPVAPL
ncbi:MAG: hypothetical protein AAGD06_12760 [Acidobacteriota bacterium]